MTWWKLVFVDGNSQSQIGSNSSNPIPNFLSHPRSNESDSQKEERDATKCAEQSAHPHVQKYKRQITLLIYFLVFAFSFIQLFLNKKNSVSFVRFFQGLVSIYHYRIEVPFPTPTAP